MKYLFSILFLLSANPTFAKNYLVYFGGGSSKVASDTAFDPNFKNILEFTKTKNWESDFYQRQSLPEGLSETDTLKMKYFNQDSFNGKISQLVSDIKNNKIKSADQLMIYIETHGGKNESNELF